MKILKIKKEDAENLVNGYPAPSAKKQTLIRLWNSLSVSSTFNSTRLVDPRRYQKRGKSKASIIGDYDNAFESPLHTKERENWQPWGCMGMATKSSQPPEELPKGDKGIPSMTNYRSAENRWKNKSIPKKRVKSLSVGFLKRCVLSNKINSLSEKLGGAEKEESTEDWLMVVQVGEGPDADSPVGYFKSIQDNKTFVDGYLLNLKRKSLGYVKKTGRLVLTNSGGCGKGGAK